MSRPITWTASFAFLFVAGIAAVVFCGYQLFSLVRDGEFSLPSFVSHATSAISTSPEMPSGAVSDAPFIPTRLVISSIGVNAAVEEVGVKSNGAMATPSSLHATGWYKNGPKAGEAGNAVIDGHVNNALGTDGVFAHLTELKVGDVVTVEGAEGQTLSYGVISIDSYDIADAPVSDLFANTGPSQLVLITCDGDYVPTAHSYDRRLVVVARAL